MKQKHAMLDIPSNSIQLTAYDTDTEPFKALFKEKIMAGLAGYVTDSSLTDEGIECACSGPLDFKGTLEAPGIDNVRLFGYAGVMQEAALVDGAFSEKSGNGSDGAQQYPIHLG